MSTLPALVIIRGGDCFENDADYLKDLEASKVRFFDDHVSWTVTLYRELNGKVFRVLIPEMPCKDNCNYRDWKLVFEKFAPQLDRATTVYVGPFENLLVRLDFSHRLLQVTAWVAFSLPNTFPRTKSVRAPCTWSPPHSTVVQSLNSIRPRSRSLQIAPPSSTCGTRRTILSWNSATLPSIRSTCPLPPCTSSRSAVALRLCFSIPSILAPRARSPLATAQSTPLLPYRRT